jgi:hypothetical protein
VLKSAVIDYGHDGLAVRGLPPGARPEPTARAFQVSETGGRLRIYAPARADIATQNFLQEIFA